MATLTVEISVSDLQVIPVSSLFYGRSTMSLPMRLTDMVCTDDGPLDDQVHSLSKIRLFPDNWRPRRPLAEMQEPFALIDTEALTMVAATPEVGASVAAEVWPFRGADLTLGYTQIRHGETETATLAADPTCKSGHEKSKALSREVLAVETGQVDRLIGPRT